MSIVDSFYESAILDIKSATNPVDFCAISGISSVANIYENPVFLAILSVVIVISILFLLIRYSRISLESLATHTTLSATLGKIRALSILSMFLFPAVSYFEAEVLELYEVNWNILFIVIIASLIPFAYSFWPTLRYSTAKTIPKISYVVIYFLIVYLNFDAALPFTLAAETSLILLFSKIIHSNIRSSVYFILIALVINSLFILLYPGVSDEGLTVYLSTSVQCSIVVLGMWLVEGSSISQFSFSSQILENADLFILVRDMEGYVVFSNKRIQQRLGLHEDQLNQGGWWDLIGADEDYRQQSKNYIQGAILTGKTREYYSYNVPAADGKTIDIFWNDSVVDNKFLINFGNEVTTEIELKSEISRLSKLALNTSSGVVRITPEGSIVWTNSSFTNIVGYSETQLVGNDLNSLIKLKRSKGDSPEKAWSEIKFDDPTEVEIVAKNGVRKWVLVSATPVLNRHEELEEVFHIWTDITDHKQLQEDYEYMVNNAADIIYTADLKGNFVYINESVKNMIGYSADALIGQHFSHVVHPKDVDMVVDFFQDQLFNRVNQTFLEFRVVSNSGEVLWVQQNTKLNYGNDASKRVIGFHAIARDITKQKELENKYAFIISNATDGIYISDYKGYFTYANDSMRNIVGFEPEQLIGKHFTELVHPEDLDDVTEFYAAQLSSLRPNTHHEFRLIDGNGNMRWVGQNVRAVFDENAPERIKEFHSIVRDITQRKSYEAELDRLSLVARKTNNIILILDKQFDIEWMNDAFINTFGYRPEEAIGMYPGDLLNGPNTDLKVIDRINKQMKSAKHVHAELLNYKKDGSEIWMEINMDPILGPSNELIGYIAVERDISERIAKEHTIEQQNQDIVDSITYSKRIQYATMTPIHTVTEIHPQTFVFHQPKDIVSGDFFLVDQFRVANKRTVPIFIIGDCTGHGVPGAMLSVLCSSTLRRGILDENIQSPAELLEYTRSYLGNFFNSAGGPELLDGMDAAICVYDKEKKKIHFSGANRPLFLYRNNEITEIKGDRQHVGYSDFNQPFTNQKIEIAENDTIYIFSDGLIDQHGGGQRKRYTAKRFKNLLQECQAMELNEQRAKIQESYEEWRGTHPQTDDICVIGVKF